MNRTTLPSGVQFAKNEAGQYIVIQPLDACILVTKEDIIAMHKQVIEDEVFNKPVPFHPFGWKTCECDGCTIYRMLK